MSYRVAICDDCVQDAEFVQGILSKWAAERQVDIQTECFPSAESFLFRYAEDKAWDILLLDIEMGAMDGVTMAKAGEIKGVGIAHRNDSEYLKSLPDDTESNNLGNLPSVSESELS